MMVDNYMSFYMEMVIVMDPLNRPIGYWLKHLHNLLEARFEQALAGFGVDRRQWQALNMLADGGRTLDALADALAPFWPDARAGVEELVHGEGGLAARGWVAPTGAGSLGLTADGRAVQGAVRQRVDGLRGEILEGVTPEQYAETVRMLAAMAGNLEARLAAGAEARREAAGQ